MACPRGWVGWISRVLGEAGVRSDEIGGDNDLDAEIRDAMTEMWRENTPITIGALALQRMVARRRRYVRSSSAASPDSGASSE